MDIKNKHYVLSYQNYKDITSSNKNKKAKLSKLINISIILIDSNINCDTGELEIPFYSFSSGV